MDGNLKNTDKLNGLSAKQQTVFLKMVQARKKVNQEKKANQEKQSDIINDQMRVPLSPAQQRIWFLQKLEPEDTSYNMPFGLKLVGKVDYSRCRQALDILAQWHDSLRTVFPVDDGKPYIQVTEENMIQIEEFTKDDIKQIDEFMVEYCSKPFSLETGPLCKIALVDMGNDVSYIVFVVHHIIFDGISTVVFMNQFVDIYNRLSHNQPIEKPKEISSYRKYAYEQNQWLETEQAKKSLDYWKSELEGELPILDFPVFHDDSCKVEGKRYSYCLDNELVSDMERYAKENKITPYILLLSAYGILLEKYTGAHDILVGSPFGNRTNMEMMQMVGIFINTLPMRLKPEDDLTIKEYLENVRKKYNKAFQNQGLPFDTIVKHVDIDRTSDAMPVYQTMFAFQNYGIKVKELDGLSIEPHFIYNNSAKFDISLSVGNETDGLTAVFEYRTDKIPSWMVENMAREYEVIIQKMIAQPEQKIKELCPLTKEQKNKILYEFNDTKKDYQRKDIIFELFQEQVEQNPDAEAVRYRDKFLTYKELDERSNQLANYLVQNGIKPDQLVGILMERSIEMVVAIYGIVKAGAAYVPIDPEYPKNRVQYMAENAQLTILLTHHQADVSDLLSEFSGEVVYLDDKDATYLTESVICPKVELTGKNLVYMIYTSGSTGNPKGVMNTHEALCNRVLWMQDGYQLTNEDTVLQKTPYCFDVSVWEFFWPLIVGARLVMAEPGGHRDAAYLCETIQKNHVTTMHFVPSMLNIFMMDKGVVECKSLKKVFCSGEALNLASTNRFFELLPTVELHNLYGPTEAAIDVTYWDCSRHYPRNIVPIGKPIKNLMIYVLNENLEVVPIGAFGELYIGGLGLARGYYNRAELTAEKFVKNPFVDEEGARIYQTGDIVRYDQNGIIEYFKRKDFQVKLRGQRIELGEIEAAIEQLDCIERAVAIVYKTKSGFQDLMAYIVKKTDVDEKELKESLKASLPSYMVPSFFSEIDEIPLTSNGKVDRKKLQSIEIKDRLGEKEKILPRNETEEKLCAVCKEVFGISSISVDDNFFDIGAYSLMIADLVYRINDLFHVDMKFKFVYENPTVELLAKYFEMQQEQNASVDLKADVSQIVKQEFPPVGPMSTADGVFLTGATGFLGAFLLERLLEEEREIYVLVRAKDEEQAMKRLKENLKMYGLEGKGLEEKVKAICGDLAKTKFGLSDSVYDSLSRKVGYIIHNGALVNYSYPYAMLRQANVLATDEMTRLAAVNGTKQIAFTSSLHVFSDGDSKKLNPITEKDFPDCVEELKIGYSQSKYCAEAILKARSEDGIPTKTYRLGRVGGSDVTGAVQNRDFIWMLVKICIELHAMPDIPMELDFIPVNFVADFIVSETFNNHNTGCYHVFNERSLMLSDLFDCIKEEGIAIQKVSLQEWLSLLYEEGKKSDANRKYTLFADMLSARGNDQMVHREYSCEYFHERYSQLGLQYSLLDKSLLKRYLNWILNNSDC